MPPRRGQFEHQGPLRRVSLHQRLPLRQCDMIQPPRPRHLPKQHLRDLTAGRIILQGRTGFRVGVQHRDAARDQAVDDGRFFARDTRDVIKSLKVGGGDCRNHCHMGARQSGQWRDFAGVGHTDFDHRKFSVGRHARQGQWHAPVIVIRRLSRVHLALAFQHRTRHFLG